MDYAISKKFGEALALGRETAKSIDVDRDVLSLALGDDLRWVEGRNKGHMTALEHIAKENGSLDAVREAAEETEERLDEMRDLYLTKGPDRADATRVFEWLGFFEGAALVIWKYLLGAADGVHYEKLRQVAADAVVFHQTLLLSAGSEEAAAGTRQGTISYENSLGNI